jgi:hypothetical protein
MAHQDHLSALVDGGLNRRDLYVRIAGSPDCHSLRLELSGESQNSHQQTVMNRSRHKFFVHICPHWPLF